MSTEPSIFTRIINREIPAEIIYEDDYSLVIPDKFPSMPGQLLVISKRQSSYIAELTDTEYSALMSTVQRTIKALDQALQTLRTCIVVEGFEVPHVHVRLYPCYTTELLLEGRKEAPGEELAMLATKIRSTFA